MPFAAGPVPEASGRMSAIRYICDAEVVKVQRDVRRASRRREVWVKWRSKGEVSSGFSCSWGGVSAGREDLGLVEEEGVGEDGVGSRSGAGDPGVRF